jgi:hypothetical protein
MLNSFWFLSTDDIFIISGDEAMVKKSGKKTHRLDCFFSASYEKVVPTLSFFTFSLISIKCRISRVDKSRRLRQISVLVMD